MQISNFICKKFNKSNKIKNQNIYFCLKMNKQFVKQELRTEEALVVLTTYEAMVTELVRLKCYYDVTKRRANF